MKNGKGIVALSVISLLIGVSGLGIGIYSMLNFQVLQGPQGPPGDDGEDGLDGLDGLNGTLDNLVAMWDQVSGSGTVFNLTLSNIQFNRSEYFNYSSTLVHLLKAGWYRISLRCLLNNIIPGNSYFCELYKNAALLERFWYVNTPSSVNYHPISAVIYVFSDGDDYFSIRMASGVTFGVIPDEDFNQLTVEYISEE